MYAAACSTAMLPTKAIGIAVGYELRSEESILCVSLEYTKPRSQHYRRLANAFRN